ncbi:putative RxLR effector [Phytophthora palmivora]|uniref:RxLR effector protein n=1 Tax=Phytophthora palmivora TaxID=4796 RepID=A0A2P4X8S3_9STRA|nr:putative RxLR effector [Phytophthora palmivora]
MRFSYLLFVAVSLFLENPDVALAKLSTLASVEADPQPNSIGVDNSKRFLRWHKRIEDEDSKNYAEKEERGKVAAMSTIDEKLEHWLTTGKSPGMVERLKLPKHGYSSNELANLAKRYGQMYRKEYGLNNGKPFTD